MMENGRRGYHMDEESTYTIVRDMMENFGRVNDMDKAPSHILMVADMWESSRRINHTVEESKQTLMVANYMRENGVRVKSTGNDG